MMNDPLFIETLRIDDGQVRNPQAHLRRMERTLREAFGGGEGFLPDEEMIPAHCRQGVVKCRIVYGRRVERIDFAPYVPRKVGSLRLVEADEGLDYHLKYADRSALEHLAERRDGCDEILIVQEGQITDTSYSNVALYDGRRYVTPEACLLPGTRREALLRAGILHKERITPDDMARFERVVLINAMLGLEENVSVPTDRVVW